MRNKIQKRQWLVLAIGLGVLGLFLLTARQMYETLFPLCPPIHLPEREAVSAVTWTKLDGSVSEITDREAIDDIMSTLQAAEPTRKWSVQDFPAVPNYGGVTLHGEAGATTVYYYLDQETWYAEQPYQGIYALSEASGAS